VALSPAPIASETAQIEDLLVGALETPLRPGADFLGKYRIERVLGRGGMGIVVAARHIELDELFAIKFLTAGDSLTAPSRFIREARAAARLTSEHAARVFDVGRLSNGTLYLVMEYLAGGTLAQVLQSRGRLPLTEAARLLLDACDALAEAHALGIVHRDLKLANLFLTQRHGGRQCLKVIDFGISKQENASEPLTTPGTIMGSPGWMSPEQIRDPQSVDARSDIWSMGVALYQLTTGQAPFRGNNFAQLLKSVLFDIPASPTKLCPELPPVCDEVVGRCLSKNPEDRYPDIGKLAKDLRKLAAETDEPPPRSTPRRVFISCRSDDQEGQRLAASFYEALLVAGASPFFATRSIVDGKHWIRDVSEALRSADAFLLLLSPQGTVSEMLAAELAMAHQLAASQGGRPYILPVRVRLPHSTQENHPMSERLQDLDHATWLDSPDTLAIVSRLLARLGMTPPRTPTAVGPLLSSAPTAVGAAPRAKISLELPGGFVSWRSPFYVAHPVIEQACLREIGRPGALIRVKSPRQMGKSSLMMGLAEHAGRSGARTVTVNLQMADAAILADQDRLLRWLCAVVTRRLKLPMQAIDAQWDDIFGAKDNCTAYFEEHLLEPEGPLVLVLDHVDRLFEVPATAEDTLTLLRAWHELGKSHSPWARLRMVLGYSTDIYLPLHINHSPFNVGLPVALGEWDEDAVLDLARRHGLSWSAAEVERLMGLLGGHPHLLRIALYHIASGMTLDSVLATAATDEGLFADHLRYLLWHVQCMPMLREAMAQVMESSTPVRIGTEVAFKLVSLGLGHLQGNEVRPARELYRRYFSGRLA
jgi:serine/threonine-protein kinase